MALVTRCTHAGCGALFRVNVAQLQAHGGQVRCGQCGQVFDAFPMLTTVPDAALRPPRPEPGAVSTDGPSSPPASAVDVSMSDATTLHTGEDPALAPALPTSIDGAEVTLPLGPARTAGALDIERRHPSERGANPLPVDEPSDTRTDVPTDRRWNAPAREGPLEPEAPRLAHEIATRDAVRSAPLEPGPAAGAWPIAPAADDGSPGRSHDDLPRRTTEPTDLRVPADASPTSADARAPIDATPGASSPPASERIFDGARSAGPQAREVEPVMAVDPMPEHAQASLVSPAPTSPPSGSAPEVPPPRLRNEELAAGPTTAGSDTHPSGSGAATDRAVAPVVRASRMSVRGVLFAAFMLLAALLAAWVLADRLPGSLADALPAQPPLAVMLALAAVLIGLLLRLVHRHAATWWLVVALLSTTLALQAAVAWRAEIASHNPTLRPLLEAICRVGGCRVGLPRESRDLAIESSDLLALDAARPQLIQLVGTIRNRGDRRVALPAIELTLTDGQERPIARRVLLPAQYVAQGADPESGVRAGEEFSIRLTLDTTDLRPVGYRLYLFHP